MDDAQLLAAYLENRECVCPACRYPITSLRGTCCPECGRELTLSLERAAERVGAGRYLGIAWMLTMLYTGVWAAFGVHQAVTMYSSIAQTGFASALTWFGMPTIQSVLTFAMVGVSIWWWRHRRDPGALAVVQAWFNVCCGIYAVMLLVMMALITLA